MEGWASASLANSNAIVTNFAAPVKLAKGQQLIAATKRIVIAGDIAGYVNVVGGEELLDAIAAEKRAAQPIRRSSLGSRHDFGNDTVSRRLGNS